MEHDLFRLAAIKSPKVQSCLVVVAAAKDDSVQAADVAMQRASVGKLCGKWLATFIPNDERAAIAFHLRVHS